MAELLGEFQAHSRLFPDDSFRGAGAIKFCYLSDPLTVGLKKLFDARVLALPVYDEKQKKFTCYFGIVDVVAWIFETFTERELKGHSMDSMLATLKDMEQIATVRNIAASSSQDPLVAVAEDTPVSEVLRMMIENRLHRVIALNTETGSIRNILTQSRMLELLVPLLDIKSKPDADRMAFNYPITQKSLQELRLGMTRPVLTIAEDQTALEAFRLMKENRVSGLAVVNGAHPDHLIDVISATDLKSIGYDFRFIHHLFLPVSEYLQVRSGFRGDLRVCGPPVTLSPQDTLEDAMKSLARQKVHRLFIVETLEDHNIPGSYYRKLRGVVTVHDVLAAFLSEEKQVASLLEQKNE